MLNILSLKKKIQHLLAFFYLFKVHWTIGVWIQGKRLNAIQTILIQSLIRPLHKYTLNKKDRKRLSDLQYLVWKIQLGFYYRKKICLLSSAGQKHLWSGKWKCILSETSNDIIARSGNSYLILHILYWNLINTLQVTVL